MRAINHYRFAFLVGCVVALSACAAVPKSPAQAIFQVEGDYAAALAVAVQYEKLPRCTVPDKQICSKSSVIKKIKKADTIAGDALDAAQKAVRDPSFDKSKADALIVSATNAVSAFARITSDLKVK